MNLQEQHRKSEKAKRKANVGQIFTKSEKGTEFKDFGDLELIIDGDIIKINDYVTSIQDLMSKLNAKLHILDRKIKKTDELAISLQEIIDEHNMLIEAAQNIIL